MERPGFGSMCSFKKQGAGAQCEFSARAFDETIYYKMGEFAQSNRRIPSKPHGKARRSTRTHLVRDEDRRSIFKPATLPLSFSECVAPDVFGRAGKLSAERKLRGGRKHRKTKTSMPD
jgi:hypothetical protein